VELLNRYWLEEPWGAWRDNIHTAIIAREIARLPWITRGKQPPSMPLEPWMVMDAEKRRQGHLNGLRDLLIGMAGGVRKHVSELKPPARKRKRRKART
jgi:hypothetical protein